MFWSLKGKGSRRNAVLELLPVPLRMSPKGDLSLEPFLTRASPLAAPRCEGGFGYMDGTGQRWRPPGKAQARGGNWSKSPHFGAVKPHVRKMQRVPE